MSKEAEASVIGCIFLDVQYAGLAANDLSAEMFQNDVTRRVFEKISDMYWSGKQIDLVTLLAELSDFKAEVTAMAQYVPALSHFNDYVRIVQDDWLAGELEKGLFHICQSGLSLEEMQEETRKLLEKNEQLSLSRNNDNISSFSEAATEFLAWLHEQEKETPKSGFDSLDRATGGLMEGSVFVLAARPGCGKTDYAVNLAMRMAKRGSRVLYFTMEMTNIQLMQRVTANLLRINGERVRDRTLTMDEMDRVDRTLVMVEQGKRMSFVQEAHISVKNVRHYVELWNPDVVIIDHIGLMERPNMRDQYRAVGEVSNRLKQLALEKKISIVELVQMNRQIENRGSKIPNLSDLRESGDLEQDSDYVGFLVPEDLKGKNLIGDESAEVSLHLQKNRHGRPGVFRYNWQPQYHTFTEVETRYG